MFTKQKAAQYFIVAWVKDWTIRSYLHVVCEGAQIDWEDAHKYFPWLPHEKSPFVSNARVRRWARDAMRKINDKLWDAQDNAARLKLSALVEGSNARGCRLIGDEARRECVSSRADMEITNAMNRQSIEQMRRSGGAHWKVCK